MAAPCDRAYLSIIWGGIPFIEAEQGQAQALAGPSTDPGPSWGNGSSSASPAVTQHGGIARVLSGLQQEQGACGSSSSSTHSASGGQGSGDRPRACSGGGSSSRSSKSASTVTSLDDLVASLRRLRPHVHAAGPFDSASRSDFVARSVISRAAPVAAAGQGSNSSAPVKQSRSRQSQGTTEQATTEQGASKQGSSDVISEATPVATHQSQTLPLPQAEQADADMHSEPASSQPICTDAPSLVPAGLAAQATPTEASSDAEPAYTRQQLKALRLYCNSVSCLEIPCPGSLTNQGCCDTAPPAQEAEGESDQGQSGPSSEQHRSSEMPDVSSSTPCLRAGQQAGPMVAAERDSSVKSRHRRLGHAPWPVRMLWVAPLVAAQHLSASDGAVAVACADGMLLLLDMQTGALIRSAAC